MNIEEGLIKYLLSGSPAVSGGRIFPVKAPQAVVKPYVVVEKISGERMRSVAGPVGRARPRFRVHVFGDTYSSVKAIITEIRIMMDGYSGLMGTVQVDAVSLETEADLYEDITKIHHCLLDFFISHVET